MFLMFVLIINGSVDTITHFNIFTLLKKPNTTYETDFNRIITMIREARQRAVAHVNTEMINLYFAVGQIVSEKVESAVWGSGVVNQLAEYIAERHPDIKGFTRRGLYRMKQFYETYRDDEKVSALRTQLTWTHHRLILAKTTSAEEREFYLNLSISEKLSSRELERQLNTGVFERTMSANQKVSPLGTQLGTPLVLKDTYILEFLNLPKVFSEDDLQKALLGNLKSFILELGKGFSFLGEEYRVEVGHHDYFIDLLFYHRDLQCLVAMELKIEEFKPEFLGKMNFYLEALDRDVKKPYENPSIGILLCKGKDKEVVEYSLARNISQAAIADYETKLIDKSVLRKKLHELYEAGLQAQETTEE